MKSPNRKLFPYSLSLRGCPGRALLAGTCLAAVASAPVSRLHAQDIDLTGYTMTFNDEFSALSVTTASPKGASKWYYWPPYGAAGAYSDSEWNINAFSISNGILWDKAWFDTTRNKWQSGNLSSMDKSAIGFAQLYGYYEVRAQMPNSGTGAWPAFWLLGVPSITDSTRKNIEIDVFEWYGSSDGSIIQQASHNWNGDGTQGPGSLYQPSTPIPGGNARGQYHTYGVLVTPAAITWVIDGQATNQIATPPDYMAQMYLMIDYALGGGWPLTGVPNPSYLYVDWVRAYTLPHGISREVWTGVTGNAVSSIPLTAVPNTQDRLSTLEAPTNWADNYGTRLRGWITAPATGSYTFWIASDDNSELWLSTDTTVGHKQKIAYVSSWTNSREWTKQASQKSAAISLTAGQAYYVEVLQKEGTGGDNLAVGWARPGQATTAPSEIVPNSVLTPFTVEPAPLAIQDGAIYEIAAAAAASERIDIYQASTADGANAQLWQDGNGANQRWKAISSGTGVWQFEPTHAPGKRLDVQNGGTANGTNVHQYTSNSSNAQKWKAIPVAGGLYEFEPLNAPGMRLDAANGGTANGTNVQIYTSNGSSSQRWRLLKQ